MPLRYIRKSDLINTGRHVKNDVYETVRFLLDSDGLGLTITDITLSPGIEAAYGYDHHVEMAYCISGRASILDLSTNLREAVTPGTLWIAEKGSRFLFRADEPTRLFCVFTPAFEGSETGFAAGPQLP